MSEVLSVNSCREPDEKGICRYITSRTDGSGDVTLFCRRYPGMVVYETCDGTDPIMSAAREIYEEADNA